MRRAIVPTADPVRDMPAGAGARLDRIEQALRALADEERRLERLGFEIPLARCRESRRYWNFMRGLFAVAADEAR